MAIQEYKAQSGGLTHTHADTHLSLGIFVLLFLSLQCLRACLVCRVLVCVRQCVYTPTSAEK